MRPVLLRWVAAFAVIVLAGVGTVALVVSLGFGPGAFVTAYLQALARRDAPSALALPGVASGIDATESRALLASGALPGLGSIRILGDEEHGDVHRVTAAWTSNGTAGQTVFEVRRIGTRFGVFPIWAFAQSPLALVQLEVDNSRTVTAGDLAIRTPGAGVNDYAVLVPGDYRLAQRTAYLTSPTVPIVADTVGQQLSTTVDVEASPRFVQAAADRLDALLAQCATQKVLFPTGCPFGQEIDDRVVSDPVWSIVDQPRMQLDGAGDDASWLIPAIPGTAHLTVQVQSLYDGSESTFDKDVPFTVRATVTYDDAGDVSITGVR